MGKTVTVYATGNGLGNNIMTIAGSLAYARATGRRLRVFWQGMRFASVPFEELLLPIPGMEVLGEEPEAADDRYLFDMDKINFYESNKYDLGALSADDVYFMTPLPFWKAEPCDYAQFRPVHELQAEVDKIMAGLGDNVIGVHLRRTDNRVAWAASPTNKFIRALGERLRGDPALMFFVCSDLRQDEKAVWQAFKKQAPMRKLKCYQSFTLRGLRDATIDMFCLARCKEILGSWYSTFSSAAAKIGGINKISIGEPE